MAPRQCVICASECSSLAVSPTTCSTVHGSAERACNECWEGKAAVLALEPLANSHGMLTSASRSKSWTLATSSACSATATSVGRNSGGSPGKIRSFGETYDPRRSMILLTVTQLRLQATRNHSPQMPESLCRKRRSIPNP